MDIKKEAERLRKTLGDDAIIVVRFKNINEYTIITCVLAKAKETTEGVNLWIKKIKKLIERS